MRTVTATRYVTPLREGGSMPALVEADDEGLYVVKLRGAGQGPKALAAEIIAGELARALELPVPELVYVDLDPHLPDAEPDPEIQELLAGSAGLNVGMDFLPGSLPYTPAGELQIDPGLAARIVWLDALTENVDRTARNVNLLIWHREPWLIDHGAALYRQHAGFSSGTPQGEFEAIADHVLLPIASSIAAADAELAPKVDRPLLDRVTGMVPEDWLQGATAAEYADDLSARMGDPRAWVAAAEEARTRV